MRAAVGAYARLELPRSVGLAETAIAALDGVWPASGDRRIRAKWHHYSFDLSLDDYFQRLAWVIRRWPDVPTQALLWKALQTGDTLIDGGANIGAMTLMGAWRVGPAGRVHAFEPSPRALDRLRCNVAANHLGHVSIHAAGLSDAEATLELSLPLDGNLGAATFSRVPDRYRGVGALSSIARAMRLDDANVDIRGQLVIKLDVEGFEFRALRGMTRILDSHRALVITEVNPEMLEHAGTSPRQLAEFLLDRGYLPHGYTTRLRRRLLLWRANAAELPVDVAWLRPESEAAHRLADSLVAAPPDSYHPPA